MNSSLIRKPKDFYSGLLFLAFGLAALFLSKSYLIGTASRMGPGYFPRALGIVLICLGAILCLMGLCSSQEAKISWHWRPLLTILFSICVFSWLAEPLGVIIASILLVCISSTASKEFKWKEALVSGIILGVMSTAIFVYGLGIPLTVWPTFINGGI